MKERLPPAWASKEQPIPWEGLTKIDGPIPRHVEQLWDEVKKLREEINQLRKDIEDHFVRNILFLTQCKDEDGT